MAASQAASFVNVQEDMAASPSPWSTWASVAVAASPPPAPDCGSESSSDTGTPPPPPPGPPPPLAVSASGGLWATWAPGDNAGHSGHGDIEAGAEAAVGHRGRLLPPRMGPAPLAERAYPTTAPPAPSSKMASEPEAARECYRWVESPRDGMSEMGILQRSRLTRASSPGKAFSACASLPHDEQEKAPPSTAASALEPPTAAARGAAAAEPDASDPWATWAPGDNAGHWGSSPRDGMSARERWRWSQVSSPGQASSAIAPLPPDDQEAAPPSTAASALEPPTASARGAAAAHAPDPWATWAPGVTDSITGTAGCWGHLDTEAVAEAAAAHPDASDPWAVDRSVFGAGSSRAPPTAAGLPPAAVSSASGAGAPATAAAGIAQDT